MGGAVDCRGGVAVGAADAAVVGGPTGGRAAGGAGVAGRGADGGPGRFGIDGVVATGRGISTAGGGGGGAAGGGSATAVPCRESLSRDAEPRLRVRTLLSSLPVSTGGGATATATPPCGPCLARATTASACSPLSALS